MKQEELAALFDRHGPMVYRRARGILGSHEDAEEAMQEVFIRALKSAEAFEHRSQLSTWLYRITTNYCLNCIRDHRRRQALWDEKVAPEGAAAAVHPADQEQKVILRRLLSEADERWAAAAVYVYLDGMSHAEAAKVLGVARRTVGSMLDKFNRWARARMDQESTKRSVTDATAPGSRVEGAERERG